MRTAERIRKLGFKRWYERTLLESHAYLVSAFLGLILTFAGIELMGERRGASSLLFGAATAAAGTVVSIFGMRRYYTTLLVAQGFSERATCRRCRTYASFNVTAAGPEADDAGIPGSTWMKVKCRKCGNEWIM